jgi:hypothetical protein
MTRLQTFYSSTMKAFKLLFDKWSKRKRNDDDIFNHPFAIF